MFYVRDLGVMVLPDDAFAENKKAGAGFTTCGGLTCLGATNCGPDPCDCGAEHSCFPGGTCANNTRKCFGPTLPKTVESVAEAQIEAIETYLARLRKILKQQKAGTGKVRKASAKKAKK
jgi:hypothetical protein